MKLRADYGCNIPSVNFGSSDLYIKKNLSTKKASIDHLRDISARLTVHQIKESSTKAKIISYTKNKGDKFSAKAISKGTVGL